MYWILFAVFLVVAVTSPRLRPVGVVGCIVLGVLLGWGMVQRLRGAGPSQAPVTETRGSPQSPAVQLRSVPVSLVTAENLRLTGSGAPFELRGRIVNHAADVALRSVTIRVTRRDCYEGALDPSGCVTLWTDDRWIALSVPPQSERDFADSIWARGSPQRARGTVHDDFEVIVAAGEADATQVERR
jgi:hypothetical protein